MHVLKVINDAMFGTLADIWYTKKMHYDLENFETISTHILKTHTR